MKTFEQSLSELIFDRMPEIVRCGEFDPSDVVLDEIIEIMIETDGAQSVYYDATDGDCLLAKLRIEAMLATNLEVRNNIQFRANQREAQLLREFAERILDKYQDRIWSIWEGGALSLPEDC